MMVDFFWDCLQWVPQNDGFLSKEEVLGGMGLAESLFSISFNKCKLYNLPCFVPFCFVLFFQGTVQSVESS